MNPHATRYYRDFSDDDEGAMGHFYKVIALHEKSEIDWEYLSAHVPSMPKGWFELAHLSPQCRIELVRDFWLGKLPYHPYAQDFLTIFFSKIDDIGVYITQKSVDSPYRPQLVYSLKDNQGFYWGDPPCTENSLLKLEKDFIEHPLPADYQAFLQIHDGFGKTTDTGTIPSLKVSDFYRKFRQELTELPTLFRPTGEVVDPQSLIPFYESFGLHCFHCFFAEWYPDEEMGNVYYSGIDHVVSDIQDARIWTENLAFPTFTDWLMFYLEEIR